MALARAAAREPRPVGLAPPIEEGPILSPRELEIARLVAIGYPNKTIAGILDISPWTVATHIRRIFAKLDVHGRPAMIAELARAGFRFDRPRPVRARRTRPPFGLPC
jgi:DNA-binding CsgD family transcriptional regulator